MSVTNRPKFTPQQINYFVMGWLLVHPNGSSTKYDLAFLERVETIFPLVVAYVLEGKPIDASYTPLAAACAEATALVFGRATLVIPPVSTTADSLPEIHHDVVPHSEDSWNSSFTHLS